VSLWGPTHLILIGSASFAALGVWILLTEGRRARPLADGDRSGALWSRIDEFIVPGALLIGLSTFQAEYDFGLPQFRLVLAPVLMMVAAGVALVAARIRSGPGGALAAVGLFLAVRGGIAALVGPALGQTTTHFPLYLAEAAAVELVALRVSTDRPLRFGAIAGAAIGSAGLAAEWGWSHVWGGVPWPSSMLAETLLLAPATAVAAGLVGGFVGRALLRAPGAGPVRHGAAAAVALAVIVGVLAWGIRMPEPDPAPSAAVTLRDAGRGTVDAEIALDPPGAARDAAVLEMHAWQGGGLERVGLRPLGGGRYATTRPIPAAGDWKTVIQLEADRAVLALPLYMPADAAIPAPEVPASPRFRRSFEPASEVFMRERRDDVPAGLLGTAYAVVLVLWSAMIAALGWGLVRLAHQRELARSFR
jgi:hypothetical protein